MNGISDKPPEGAVGFFERGFRLGRGDAAGLILRACGFFVARASIFGMLNPLGIAYISIWLCGGGLYLAAIFAGLGFLTGAVMPYAAKYYICLALLCVANWLVRLLRVQRKAFTAPAIAAGAMLISALAASWFTSAGAYGALMSVLEAVLVFALAYVFSQGEACLRPGRMRGSLTNEEMVSLALIAAGVAAGAAGIHIGPLSLRYFFCLLITALMAGSGGVGVGTAAGLLLGLLMSLTGYESLSFAIILAIGGMVAGALRRQARIPCFLGLCAGAGVCAVFLDLSLMNIEAAFSALLAGAAYCLIPARFVLNIYSAVTPAAERGQEYRDRVRELSVGRIRKLGCAVSRLAAAFGELPRKKDGLSNKEVNALIDDIAAQVCGKCRKCDECWSSGFYGTYSGVFAALGRLDKRDDAGDIERDIDTFCIRPGEFYEASSRYFELYRQSLAWQNRVLESRGAALRLLAGVSGIVLRLADDMEGELAYGAELAELENRLLAELSKNKVEVESVIVLQNKLGKYEVEFSQKPGLAARKQDADMTEILRRLLGRGMKKDEEAAFFDGDGRRLNRFKYIEEQRFRMTCGAAREVKAEAEESGDSYSFMELKDGRCLMALADGMGSGRRARDESGAAIELLEDFVSAGFERDDAVRLINSSLLLRSGGESFSTLDICSVDLETGQAEFVKIGAASTLLLRDGSVEVLRSWTLPAGIMNDVETDACKRRLMHGDIIIMMTDGVIDAGDGGEDKEAWAVRTVKELDSDNPQDIADRLLTVAGERCGGRVRDDMTVLAGRIWERYKRDK